MARLLRPALLFIAIGIAIYAALFAWSERLVHREGHANPLFKIDRAAPEPAYDWIVLGASHAMPLDFGGVNDELQAGSGRRILQLAGPGTGPLYNRFVLEHFLRRHAARRLIYVADGFAFYSRAWNEDRFADAKLLRRTPWDAALVASLWTYVRDEHVDATALLDYASGFSKINNRERFQRDAWEGEAQFESSARPSLSAMRKRTAYLYPDGTTPETLAHYLDVLASLLDLARRRGMDVVVLKMPVPPTFARLLPGETAFDDALARVAHAHGARVADFSAAVPDPRWYFDTDHLNRKGVQAFAEAALLPLLRADGHLVDDR